MWIFAKSGFFSVVVDAQHEGMMLVRARCALDIAALWKDHKDALPSMTEPTSDETRDYRWRCSLSHADFVTLAGRLAAGVDYSNFKNACHAEPSQQSKSSALMTVWAAMLDVQRTEMHGKSQDVAFANFDDAADAADAAWASFVARKGLPIADNPDTTSQKPPKRKTGKRKAKKLF
jgi:hypothetical protein